MDNNTSSHPDQENNEQAATPETEKIPESLQIGHVVAHLQDPLSLMTEEEPADIGRIVLWTISVLILACIVWSIFGKLDIVATAEGKLVPHTLIKIVQPSEAGIIQHVYVTEGESVKQGQVLARMDSTLFSADREGAQRELAYLHMQERRMVAELSGQQMLALPEDDTDLYAKVNEQYFSHKNEYMNRLAQQISQLEKMKNEKESAKQMQTKMEKSLPLYKETADIYNDLENKKFFSHMSAAEKQRDYLDKKYELEAQRASVKSIENGVKGQEQRVQEIQNTYQNELNSELLNTRARIDQKKLELEKNEFKEGQMEIKASQNGIITDLVITTQGTVVQPGTVIMSLVPENEKLYADVAIRNEDVGFVHVGQEAKIKVIAYPFQQYGMLIGQVERVSADAESNQSQGNGNGGGANQASFYKARVVIKETDLKDSQGKPLQLFSGMQVVAEINQGNRTIMNYFVSNLKKVLSESVSER